MYEELNPPSSTSARLESPKLVRQSHEAKYRQDTGK